VSNQTTIIGTEEVAVKADKVKIEGAVIANVDKDGVDQGNLRLETDELVVTDIQDTDYQYSESYGVGGTSQKSSMEIGKKSGRDGTGGFAGGSVNLSYANSGHDKEQITRATVGKGELVVGTTVITKVEGDEVEGLNRDVEKAQELVKDEKLGGYDIDVTLDVDMISNPIGWTQDSLGAVLGLVPNTIQAAGHVGNLGGAHFMDTMRELQGKTVIREEYINNSEVDNYIDRNGEYAVGSISLNEERTVYDPTDVTAIGKMPVIPYAYVELAADIDDPMRPVWRKHLYQRQRLNHPEQVLEDATKTGEKQPGFKTVYHRVGVENEKNVKIVFQDGSEGVYNFKTGILVSDHTNRGTFNYGKSIPGHVFKDMAPYLLIGNSPEDKTNILNRTLLTGKGAYLGIKERLNR